jgi:hypothetical protein
LPDEEPSYHRTLLDYPKANPSSPNFKEMHAWVAYLGDGKPCFALHHRMGLLEGDSFFFAERIYYNSRNYNSIQAIGVAIPVKEGIALAISSRTSTDLITGFGGGAKRAVATKMMGNMAAEFFERFRQSEAKVEKEEL